MSRQMSLDLPDVKLSLSERLMGLLAVVIAYVVIRLLPLELIGKILHAARRFYSREIYPEEADIAWGAVRQTGLFLLGRVACMELSLAFVLFALVKGRSATWCVGTKTDPFEAHAWVEVGGKPFRESDGIEQEFKRLFVV